MTTVCRRTMLKLLSVNLGAALSSRSLLNPAFASADNDGSSQTMSEKIADFIVRARFKDLSEEVIRKAKEQIVYHFGLAFSGWSTQEAKKMRELLQRMDQPEGGSTVIADKIRLLPADAAFANCNLMRATWRDDVVWPAGIHAGLMTLPTALAIGEAKRVSGQELLLAMVLGYEVLGKLGTAGQGWEALLPRRPTMIYGSYGPTTVAGRLLNLDRKRMANALGYAANLGMGIPEGGQTEHFYGLLSRNATFAAQLAEVGGAPYSRTTIEGSSGLFRSFFGKVPPTLPGLIDRLGVDWEILRAAQKRYPGTSQNTVATELMLDFVKQQKLTAAQVTHLDVFVSFAEESAERKKELTFRGPFDTWMDAYSSLPYALAIVLIDGQVAPRRFKDENIHDPAVGEVMQKINMSFEEGHGVARYCRLEAHTMDGRKLVADSGQFKISENFTFPFPPSVWPAWLQEDGKTLLPPEQLHRLLHMISDLENLDDVSRLMVAVRSAR